MTAVPPRELPGDPAAPEVIEGTVTPEDIVRANLRAAGIPVATAADAAAIRAEAEQWARDFAAAGRAEDPIVIGHDAENRQED